MARIRALLVVLLVLLGAVAAAFALGILGTPGVEAVENRFGAVTAETTAIETDLVVSNPNPIGVQLGGASVNYSIAMNQVPLASGDREGLRMERGNTTLQFTTEMDNERIPRWWVTHVRRGEQTTVAIDATVDSSLLGRSFGVPIERDLSTDIIGQFNSTETRPVNADQPLVSDPVLYVNETRASWGSVSERTTPIEVRFTVYNPKAEPYAITEIGYDITMNDVQVGSGVSQQPYAIPPHSSETIETTTAIENSALDEWWVSHLERNQVTDLRIDFYARLELPGGETVRVPLDALTYEKEIETDVFGTKPASTNETATPTPSEADSTATGSPGTSTTAAGPDGPELPGEETSTAAVTPTPTETPTATSTPTGTSTPTPTQTSTPTDDGLLGY